MKKIRKNINHKDIGIRIRFEREKLNLSRERFAEIIDLSPFYIGQLERGERKMSLDTLVNISMALNVSLDYLLFGYTYYMQNISIQESFDDIYKESIDNELKELIDILKGSTKEQITLIKEISRLVLPSIKR